MHRQEILDNVRNIILAINNGLFPDDVSEFASMTYDLGMDSFHLESMISRLKDEVADIEFTPWYIKASRRGHDTVGSLVDFIDERLVRSVPAELPEGRATHLSNAEPRELDVEVA
ncbi:acyl carrier protein [Archangium gephyra]|uniref:acyl carrier protein n=1 Tax=Archangium gephyra TaxID=48 RepID=UPI003B7ED318